MSAALRLDDLVALSRVLLGAVRHCHLDGPREDAHLLQARRNVPIGDQVHDALAQQAVLSDDGTKAEPCPKPLRAVGNTDMPSPLIAITRPLTAQGRDELVEE